MLDDWILEYVGEWIEQYPYVKGLLYMVLLLIIFTALQNMLYGLTKFISGER